MYKVKVWNTNNTLKCKYNQTLLSHTSTGRYHSRGCRMRTPWYVQIARIKWVLLKIWDLMYNERWKLAGGNTVVKGWKVSGRMMNTSRLRGTAQLMIQAGEPHNTPGKEAGSKMWRPGNRKDARTFLISMTQLRKPESGPQKWFLNMIWWSQRLRQVLVIQPVNP